MKDKRPLHDSQKITARQKSGVRGRYLRPSQTVKLEPQSVRAFLDAYTVWRQTQPVSHEDLDNREHEALRALEFLADAGALYRDVVQTAAQRDADLMRTLLDEIFSMAFWNDAPQRTIMLETDSVLFAEIVEVLRRTAEPGQGAAYDMNRLFSGRKGLAIEPLPDAESTSGGEVSPDDE